MSDNTHNDHVGFIGLGAMGNKMVPHLLKAGYQVFVCDVDSAAVGAMVMLGAARCETPRQVADNADIVLTCVPTPDVVERVTLGEAGIHEGSRVKVVVDHSTTGPSMARSIADRLAQQGITSLDAPLAGGVAGAAAGTLSVMVSGDRDAYLRCEPVFKAFGRKVVHVGDSPGMGQALKLVNNMIVAATLVATTEAVLFGLKSGLQASTLLEVLNVSTARSYTSEQIVAGTVLDRVFDFGFRLELMRKDIRLFVNEAESMGSPAFTSVIVKQFYDQAVSEGLGKEDMTHVVKLLERMAGVQIAR